MAGAISMSECLSKDSIQIAIVGRNDNTESNFRMLMDYPAKVVSGDSGPLYGTRPAATSWFHVVYGNHACPVLSQLVSLFE